MDPCLNVIEPLRGPTPLSAWQRQLKRWLARASLYAPTPFAAFEVAVRRELAHLLRSASEQLQAPLEQAVRGESDVSVAAKECRLSLDGGQDEFPRDALSNLCRLLAAREERSELQELLKHWLARHDALRHRLAWLVDPESTRRRLDNLDPRADADQLWSFVKYDFRPQILHAGWANAIKRVAQNQALSTFIHSTRLAETNPLKRTEDTLYFLYYRFNWGGDSSHGSEAVRTVNQIHGRYTIPNEGMKFVLLDSAFSVLDAIDALGHRPLTSTERLGYFHATVNLGCEMNISELSHDYDEMIRWFRDRCAKYRDFAPQKRRLWLNISESFDAALKLGPLTVKTRRSLEVIAMDDSYRQALGFSGPRLWQVGLAKSLMKLLASARRQLPSEAYVESLQPCYSYPQGASVDRLGETTRSSSMPATCPFSGAEGNRTNQGFAENQLPVRAIEQATAPPLATVTWEEVARHNRPEDLWLVFDGHVYDVSAFAANHPGGLAVLLAGHGQDLTVAYARAAHSEMAQIFALNFRIGKIADAERDQGREPIQSTDFSRALGAEASS